MKYCIKCGYNLDEHNAFCFKCGTPVEKDGIFYEEDFSFTSEGNWQEKGEVAQRKKGFVAQNIDILFITIVVVGVLVVVL